MAFKRAFRSKWHAMATTWVEKKNILNKYNPKAWKKSGANLGRSILCLQKKSVNIAKMAFLDDFASLTIFKVKKISLWVLQWSKYARTAWHKYYRTHFYQKIDFQNFSPNPPLTAHCGGQKEIGCNANWGLGQIRLHQLHLWIWGQIVYLVWYWPDWVEIVWKSSALLIMIWDRRIMEKLEENKWCHNMWSNAFTVMVYHDYV